MHFSDDYIFYLVTVQLEMSVKLINGLELIYKF